MNKPRIFLGSSGEQAKLLRAIARGLSEVADVEPWTTTFNPGRSTLDRSAATLALDRLAKLLVDRANLRRAGGRVVAHGGQPEQVARQLRTVRVEDERAPDAERAAEQSCLEHHVVAR